MGAYLKASAIAISIPFLNWVFLVLAGFVQLKTVSVGTAEAVRAATEAPLNIGLAQAAGVAVLFLVAFPHRSRSEGFLDAVHVKPLVGGVVLVCFAAGLLLQFPLAELGNMTQAIWPMSFDELARRYQLLTPQNWWAGFSALIAFVLIAPVTEEIVFRGWLMPMLGDRYGRTAGLIGSSVLFGLVHIEPSAVIYATVAGFVLGVVAMRAKSTLASIALHAGVNATPLLLPVTLVRIPGFNTLTERVEHIAPWLVAAALIGTGALLMLFWRATE
ncbi:MAG: CPBP family intramembrane glutamic endopeptidase [Myxococcota bacterium]